MVIELQSRIESDFAELSERFRGLNLVFASGGIFVQGVLGFSAQYGGVVMADSYTIEIGIPHSYPSVPPNIRECGDRVPKEFHTGEDGLLCLGSSLDVKMKFDANPTLLGYVTELVIPYFFSFSCWEKYGVMPYGELPHGGEGILNYYCELFNTPSHLAVLNLLALLATESYRGHIACPCGSGLRLRKCHGSILMRISVHQGQVGFLEDLVRCVAYLREAGKYIPDSALSEKTLQLMSLYIATIAKRKDDLEASAKKGRYDIGGHHD